jgi:peptide/nickel transport system permease protein
MLGTQPSTPQLIAALKTRYHLDDPFIVQYWHWLISASHGDFGRSVQSGQSVTSVVSSHLPVTLELAAFALVLVVVIGIPAGMLAGIRWGGRFDKGVSALTVFGMSAPGFAVGIVLIYLFGVEVQIFPTYGAGNSNPVDRIEHLTLPAVALGIGLIGILVRYALRNTALPIVTAAGLLLIVAISGAVLIETVFSLQGEGQLMVQSVTAKDIPVVQGLAIFVALFVVVVNLIVDALALIIDPRTRVASRS